jgi:hypothetical protein
MTQITLNSINYDFVLRTDITKGSLVMMPKYINQPAEIDTNVWSKRATVVTYEMRVTDAEKWTLDQLLTGHTVTTLVDDIYGWNNNVWVRKIDVEYARNENDTYRWRLTIELIIIE